MIKKLIIVIFFLTCVTIADVVTHGWILFDNKDTAQALLTKINSNFPQTSQYSGKVFPYWMKEPASIMRIELLTNVVDGVTNTVEMAVATGHYLVLVRPTISAFLTTKEQADVKDTLPDGCFIKEAE